MNNLLSRPIVNGSLSKVFRGVFLTLLIAFLTTVGWWTFTTVRDSYYVFAMKSDVIKIEERLDKDIDRTHDRIDRIAGRFDRMEDKFDGMQKDIMEELKKIKK